MGFATTLIVEKRLSHITKFSANPIRHAARDTFPCRGRKARGNLVGSAGSFSPDNSARVGRIKKRI